MTKAIHDGTCQFCTRQQAVKDGLLVNHGYVVHWNQFNGICRGARRLALELSNTLALRTIAQLDAEAELNEAITAQDIKSSTIVVRRRGGDSKTTIIKGQSDLDIYRRSDRYAPATFLELQETEVRNFHGRARTQRAHSALLTATIAARHGQPLIPRSEPERKKKEGFSTYSDAHEYAETLKKEGFTTRITRVGRVRTVTGIKK